MVSLIFNIACICAGLLLAVSHLDRIDGKSNFFVNIASKLKPLNVVIGVITLAIGVLFLLKVKCMVFSIVGIACGLLLLPQQLGNLPLIGDFLVKISKAISPYKVIVGDAALILGILSLLRMNPFC